MAIRFLWNLLIQILPNWLYFGAINFGNKFMKRDSVKHFPAKGEATLSGVIVDCDVETGLAKGAESYIFGGQLNKA